MKTTWIDNKQWTFADVKQAMVNYYIRKHNGDQKDDGNRKLGVTKTSYYHEDGVIYFTLHGSPPKGYATWIEERRLLTLLSPSYKIWRQYYLNRGLTNE